MALDLHDMADAVHDEESFLEFMSQLCADWEEEREIEATKPSSPYSAGALGWENGNIGAFLDAAAAWGTATINGAELYKKPDNPWRRAAQILHAGKFYE